MSPDFLSPPPVRGTGEAAARGNRDRRGFEEGGGDRGDRQRNTRKRALRREIKGISRSRKKKSGKLQSHQIRQTVPRWRWRGMKANAAHHRSVAEKFFPTATDPHSPDSVRQANIEATSCCLRSSRQMLWSSSPTDPPYNQLVTQLSSTWISLR